MNTINNLNYVNAIGYDVLGDGGGINFSQQPLAISVKSNLNDRFTR